MKLVSPRLHFGTIFDAFWSPVATFCRRLPFLGVCFLHSFSAPQVPVPCLTRAACSDRRAFTRSDGVTIDAFFVELGQEASDFRLDPDASRVDIASLLRIRTPPTM